MKKIDSDVFVFEDFDTTLISFQKIFSLVQFHVYNNIYKIYGDGYTPDSYRDLKLIFVHHLIIETCKRINEVNSYNKVLYIDKSFIDIEADIWRVVKSKEDFCKFIFKTFKMLSKLLPFSIIVSKEILNFEKHTSGELLDLLNRIRNNVDLFDQQINSVKRMKLFTHQNGLRYIEYQFLHDKEFAKLLM